MKTRDLQDHLKSGGEFGFDDRLRRPCSKIVCADGFQVSVQASNTHYCTPRNNEGPYTEVEVGYLSRKATVSDYETLADYADNGSIYVFVPIGLVEAVLEAHGGVDWTATIKEKKE